jgi:tetratricopeptide (TPR) repeat protein
LNASHEPSKQEFHRHREEIQDTTLEWLLNDKRIGAFLGLDIPKMKQLLWIRGPPRIGKSCAAAYLVDRLRKRCRGSVVTYYFFRASRNMTHARDAVNAIAYQLQRNSSRVPEGRSNTLINAFQNQSDMGMKYLIQKHLGPYLSQISTNIFVILDGLDEADFTRSDAVDSNKSEMSILLNYLANLPKSIRVLFVSRPSCMIHKSLSSRITGILDFPENCRAIETYVERFISNHPWVGTLFLREGIVPVDYFRRHANGNITWTQNALKELSAIIDQASFRRCIEDLPKHSKYLHREYCDGLLSMSEYEQRLAKEIFYTLSFSAGHMLEMLLKQFIEWSLETKFSPKDENSDDGSSNDLRTFLTEQGGSYVEIKVENLDHVFSAEAVSFRHSSFGSFMNSDLYRDELEFDPREMHTRIALRILRCLTERLKSEDLHLPTTIAWKNHLPKAVKSGVGATQLLIQIYFFLSEPCTVRLWLNWTIKRDSRLDSLPLSSMLIHGISAVDAVLDIITNWLKSWKDGSVDIKCLAKEADVNEADLQTAIKLRHNILEDPTLLKQYVGKLSGYEALHSGISNPLFALAFRQYSAIRPTIKLSQLVNELIQGNLEDMVKWIGVGEWQPRPFNLGFIFHNLHAWDRSIEFCKLALQSDESNYEIWVLLGHTYEYQGNHLMAAEAFKNAIKHGFGFHHGCNLAACVYRRADDLKGFHKFAQEMAITEQMEPTFWLMQSVSVMDVYLTAGDYRSAIRYWDGDLDELGYLLEAYDKINYDDERIIPHLNYLLEHLPSHWGRNLLDGLRKAYLAENNVKAAIETVERALKIDPDSSHWWTSLIDIYLANHNQEQAIVLMDKRLTQNPTCITVWEKLFEVLLSAGEIDGLLNRIQKMSNISTLRNSCNWFQCFYHGCLAKGRVFEQNGKTGHAISIYQNGALDTDTAFQKLWARLLTMQEIRNDRSKGAEISRSLVEALLEDRRNRRAGRLRTTFRKNFITGTMNSTIPWFAVWYGLVSVLNLVWEEMLPMDSKKWTPLHVAAHEGHEKVVDFILKKSKR